MASLALFASLLAASPAHAVELDHHAYISTAAGYFWTDAGEHIDSTWTANLRLGYGPKKWFAIEGEGAYLQGRTRTNFNYVYSATTPRVNALAFVAPNARVKPFLLAGAGAIYKYAWRDPDAISTNSNDLGWGQYENPDLDFLINAGAGLFVPLWGPASLRADFRYLMNIGSEPHGIRDDVFSDWEATVGVAAWFGGGGNDKDFDGIVDKVDSCPTDPEDLDRFEDSDGCPDDDNDRDSVMDWDDACPDAAEDRDRWEDADGCPDDDNDADGLTDDGDQCPNQPEDLDGFLDRDGCPDEDNDGDGLLDVSDQCPNHPEDLDGFRDADGCADTDNDADGLADYRDECPDVPESYNGFDDLDGCPDAMPDDVQRFTGVIRGVNFRVNSAEITIDSYGLLDDAAAMLSTYDHLRIEVQGHTDSDGGEDFNLDLSQRRSESVRSYLMRRGIDPDRLEANGYGEREPLVSNGSTGGKAVNRRVEFQIIASQVADQD
jgi:outer membrane protein OmpA-like peptidoglycan-associated protein